MKRFLLIEVEEEDSSDEDTVYDYITELYHRGYIDIICNWRPKDVFKHGSTEIAFLGGYECKCGDYWGSDGCSTQKRGF